MADILRLKTENELDNERKSLLDQIITEKGARLRKLNGLSSPADVAAILQEYCNRAAGIQRFTVA